MAHARDNYLLAQLTEAEFEKFHPHLELRSLSKGEVLVRVNQIGRHVYFPIGAVVSICIELEDGYSVENTMVGKSGMVGLTSSGQPSFYTAKVKDAGFAYRMRVPDYLAIREHCPSFMIAHRGSLVASARHLHFAAVCGKHHSVEQQIIRWLLNNLDRSMSNVITTTQQELSELLGFSREFITVVLGRLSIQGLILIARGQLEVPDRTSLEERSCECYWLARGLSRPLFTALLGSPPPHIHNKHA